MLHGPLERDLTASTSDIFCVNDRASEYARLMDPNEEVMQIDTKEEIANSPSIN